MMNSDESFSGWFIAIILTALMLYVLWGMMVASYDTELHGASFHENVVVARGSARATMIATSVSALFHFCLNSILYLPQMGSVISHGFTEAAWIPIVGGVLLSMIWGGYYLSGLIQPGYRKTPKGRRR